MWRKMRLQPSFARQPSVLIGREVFLAADTKCKHGGTLQFGRQVVWRRLQRTDNYPGTPRAASLLRSQQSDELARWAVIVRCQPFDKVTSCHGRPFHLQLCELSVVLKHSVFLHCSSVYHLCPSAAYPVLADRGSSSQLFWLGVKTTGFVLLCVCVCEGGWCRQGLL